MFKWGAEKIKRDYYVHRGGYNVTQAITNVDLPNAETRNTPRMPPQKFKNRIGDKKYTFNPEKFRRNMIILCVSLLGVYIWFLFWFLWARGVTN